MDSGEDEDRFARSSMVKPIDSWWTVLLIDPVAVPLTRFLARRTSVTPVAVTCAAHLLGAVSIFAFATGRLVLGAVLFEVRFILDCVDGKLARATGQTSDFGRELDVRGDQVVAVGMIIALGWHADFAGTAFLAGVHPLHMFFLDTRNRLSTAKDTGGTGPSAGTGWRSILARNRMYPVPTSVDIEHLTFLVGPLTATLVGGLDPVLWLATAWFGLQLARYSVDVLRLARRADIDRHGSP